MAPYGKFSASASMHQDAVFADEHWSHLEDVRVSAEPCFSPNMCFNFFEERVFIGMDFIDYVAFTWLVLIGIAGCKAAVDSARFQILYRKVSGNPRFPILPGETPMFPRTKSGIVDPFSIIYTRRILQALYAKHEDPRLNSLARMVRTEFHWGLALVPIGFVVVAVLVFTSKPTG